MWRTIASSTFYLITSDKKPIIIDTEYKRMPEGPECAIMVDDLQSLVGKKLTSVKIKSGRYVRHGAFEGYRALNSALPAVIKYIANQGKFIYIGLAGQVGQAEHAILISLAMTGELLTTSDKYTRIVFKMGAKQAFYLNDMRNFATITYDPDLSLLQRKLTQLGPDPIRTRITPTMLTYSPSKKVGDVLLDQRVIAGIGNYLRSDILYTAKISPTKRFGALTAAEKARLAKAIMSVSRASYRYQQRHDLWSYPFVAYQRTDLKTVKMADGRRVYYR